MSLLALMPSPLLGDAMWQSTAQSLQARGHPAMPVLLEGAAPRSAGEALEQYLRALPEAESVVLVPHSNAGLYVPAITAVRNVAAVIFVDAGLPPIGAKQVSVAPSALLDFLAPIAGVDGLLPRWSQWWDDADVAALYPDEATRSQVEGQQRRLPLSYFEDHVPVPDGWGRLPCGYLAFGDTYGAETETAREAQWPVRVLNGDHLEMTVHPDVVAESILDLLDEASHAIA